MSFTIWFTGLSGSGKTTLSKVVYLALKQQGFRAEWIDGDIIRANFSQELGFSKRDRDINVRRIAFVSHLLNKNDVISVVAAIAPYQETRRQSREFIGDYIEVFCDCTLETVIKRDVKGLYKKAIAGEIRNFTGINDPYEKPDAPEIAVKTNEETVETSLGKIFHYLGGQRHIPNLCLNENLFNCPDEDRWRNRLQCLGFSL